MEETRYLLRWPATYQTRLGRSESGELIIVKRPRSRPTSPCLLDLPDELLVWIVKLAATPVRPKELPPSGFADCGHKSSQFDYTWDFADGFRDAVALSIVCRRLNHLVTPVLYREIHPGVECRCVYRGKVQDYGVTLPYVPGALPPTNNGTQLPPAKELGGRWFHNMSWKATAHLHRTLSQNKLLRGHCRELHLSQEDQDRHGRYWVRRWGIYKDLLQWANRATIVTISLWGNAEFWQSIPEMVKDMKSLETLHVNSRGAGWLSKVLRNAPNLKTVRISGLDTAPRDEGPTGISPLKTLEIGFWEGFPEEIPHVLQIPAGLEHFKVERPNKSLRRSCHFTLPIILAALTPHKSTLRTLDTGKTYPYTRGRGHVIPDDRGDLRDPFYNINLSDFTALESLTLWNKLIQPKISKAHGHDAILSVPNLRKFTWRFPIVSDTTCKHHILREFEEQEEEWLLTLAQTAMERNHPLEHIHIEGSDIMGLIAFPEIYPWDRMDRVATLIQPGGITLTRDEPSISREVFDKIVDYEVEHWHNPRRPPRGY
ncbi:hypothetical protein OQA88_13675 [Cercophora sp. LCS_1]